ncbi:hypothetical protein L1I30_01535 [Gillisia sp. M10.2A]|uniref:Lipoprotein n=1 Tax=Gillisia lutea TaxID=2909668 RepID=A0ABS9EFU9_9FLAO|nr:hypothetical protein [Gillisia lutea]MCF4100336.1 hypothetical protein [Gillisia lutea]
MRKIVFVILALTIISCNSSKKAISTNSNKFIVEDLTAYNSEQLKELYPDANMREDKGMFEEGTVERAYCVLYPNTPNELHITWQDDEKSKIHDIRFSDSGKWQSSTGIRVGTSYTELNDLNAKPISFYGFGWDYSGAVLWNEGKLENSQLHVFLTPNTEPKSQFYGDHIIKASEKEIEELDLHVQTLILKVS